jgi:hypothetical protein
MIIIYNFYVKTYSLFKKYTLDFFKTFFWIVCFSKDFNQLEKKVILAKIT